MEEIYRKAYLTIAASASPDNSTGLLTSRAFSSLNSPWGPTNPKYISIKSKIKHHSTPETDPLSTRAWAYQERLMASRILSYRPEEFVWECRQACWHECGLSADCSGYGAYLSTADRGGNRGRKRGREREEGRAAASKHLCTDPTLSRALILYGGLAQYSIFNILFNMSYRFNININTP